METITMTTEQLADYSRNIVLKTLHELGVKPNKDIDWIPRFEVIKIIGRAQYEKAVRNGMRIKKDANGSKCSRVVVMRDDFVKRFKHIINE